MKFIDFAEIDVQSGKGGAGCCSFRREKFVPKGGPDGGDGGRGAHVIIQGDAQMNTLLDYRYKRHYKGRSGDHGQGAKKHGKNAEDIILRVPLGTVIKDRDSDLIVCDILSDGQQYIAAKGGDGGRGNVHFKTSVNQAPRRSEEGFDGEHRELKLELKLLADVGLVGCPNAGKSTLVTQMSAAHPKIGNYPFTTLRPVLGVVDLGQGHAFVMADIPGLIEGAHEGVGLGDDFLRHIERCRVLLFVIDLSGFSNDPWDDYQMLLKEIEAYDSRIVRKKRMIVLNKCDLNYNRETVEKFRNEEDIDVMLISSATGEGCEALRYALSEMLKEDKDA